MKSRSLSLLGIIVVFAIVGMLLTSMRSFTPSTDLNKLSPSGAGAPSTTAPGVDTSRSNVYIGGTNATGRVAEVYLKVAQDVFLSVDKAPKHLRDSAERWVDVQFPDPLANGIESTRALISSNQTVQVGDVVEIRVAHTKVSRDFPVRENTRVTDLVAKKGEMLARDYERRIFARNGQGGSPGPVAELLKLGASQQGASLGISTANSAAR